MDINLHIERLVLDGVDITSGQGELLQASVANELTRMLNSGGIASSLSGGGSLKGLAANSIQIENKKPQVLGQQIAQSVYGGIGRE